MALAYLGLGANLGDRMDNLSQAIALLTAVAGRVKKVSSFYETQPWGYESNHRFINAAVMVETSLSPQALLETIEAIEHRLGRTTKSVDGKYADRTIDIDILLYDDLCLQSPRLTIPHPHMTERRFVLEPLAEIAPDALFPPTGKTVATLLAELYKRERDASL